MRVLVNACWMVGLRHRCELIRWFAGGGDEHPPPPNRWIMWDGNSGGVAGRDTGGGLGNEGKQEITGEKWRCAQKYDDGGDAVTGWFITPWRRWRIQVQFAILRSSIKRPSIWTLRRKYKNTTPLPPFPAFSPPPPHFDHDRGTSGRGDWDQARLICV